LQSSGYLIIARWRKTEKLMKKLKRLPKKKAINILELFFLLCHSLLRNKSSIKQHIKVEARRKWHKE
jgi:hypothetical protein